MLKATRLLILLPLFFTCSCLSVYSLSKSHLDQSWKKSGMHERVVRITDATVNYWDGGQGPVLVLLMGFGADAQMQWSAQIAAFSRKFRVIAPDLVYFGKSTSTSNDYSAGFQARCVFELLDSLQVDTINVLGISYGGFVAFEMVKAKGGRIRKLIITDSPGHEGSLRDIDSMVARLHASTVTDIFVPQTPAAVGRLLGLCYYKEPYIPGFILQELKDSIFSSQTSEKTRLLENLLGSLDYLKTIPYPAQHDVLVVWGKHDKVFPLALGQSLVQAIGARARISIFENGAHAPNVECSREFNRTVLEFLGKGDKTNSGQLSYPAVD